ncbi:hypothetical protein [Dendronalium sp. ChiSLP03b]|nr:hypothetical protein [Dendronalium sp. ChiSLP03b]MDZ8205192.1 hypothetical protein [Dendronalium sp. ChiSLP03b]
MTSENNDVQVKSLLPNSTIITRYTGDPRSLLALIQVLYVYSPQA